LIEITADIFNYIDPETNMPWSMLFSMPLGRGNRLDGAECLEWAFIPTTAAVVLGHVFL